MVHICKGNFPTVFSNHCHHGYCGGRAQSTINIFNNCGGGHTNFWGGFGAGLGFGLGNLFGGFGMGNIFGGFGMGMPMFGGMGMGMPMFGGMNMWSPWQSFGMDQFQWNNGRNNGSTAGANKGSNNSNKPGDAKADFIDEDNNKIVAIEGKIKEANTPEDLQKAIDELDKLKKELTDHYKNDKRVEELGIDKLISDAKAKKAQLAAEQAEQQQQPGSADGAKPSELQKAKENPNGSITATENPEVKSAELKDVEYEYELKEDNYKKIDSFDNSNKVINVIDAGKPRDVSGECQYGETNTEKLPSTITMTDSNNKYQYKYEYIGKTKEGYPVYGTPNRTQKYILVKNNDNGEYVLYQPESFTGYDVPDNQLKPTTGSGETPVNPPVKKLSNEEAINVISEMLPVGLTNIKLNPKTEGVWTYVSIDGSNYKFAYRLELNSDDPTDIKDYEIKILKDKESIYQNHINSTSNNNLDKKAIALIKNANLALTSNKNNTGSSKINLDADSKKILETISDAYKKGIAKSTNRSDGHVIITIPFKKEAIFLYRKNGVVTRVGLWKGMTTAAKLGINKANEVCAIPVKDIENCKDKQWEYVLKMINKHSK